MSVTMATARAPWQCRPSQRARLPCAWTGGEERRRAEEGRGTCPRPPRSAWGQWRLGRAGGSEGRPWAGPWESSQLGPRGACQTFPLLRGGSPLFLLLAQRPILVYLSTSSLSLFLRQWCSGALTAFPQIGLLSRAVIWVHITSPL